LKLVEIENVTPKKDFVESQEDQQALNQARTKRAIFNFKMVDIPVGAELISPAMKILRLKLSITDRLNITAKLQAFRVLLKKYLDMIMAFRVLLIGHTRVNRLMSAGNALKNLSNSLILWTAKEQIFKWTDQRMPGACL